jgi:hypothetical protein
MNVSHVDQERITPCEVLPTEETNISSPSMGSLVPVQVALTTKCAGTQPAPKSHFDIVDSW